MYFQNAKNIFTRIDLNFHLNCTTVLLHTSKFCQKTDVEKFSFSGRKIEKAKFFTQSLTKIFRISVFNVGGCLASCLIFRPFLTLDP